MTPQEEFFMFQQLQQKYGNIPPQYMPPQVKVKRGKPKKKGRVAKPINWKSVQYTIIFILSLVSIGIIYSEIKQAFAVKQNSITSKIVKK